MNISPGQVLKSRDKRDADLFKQIVTMNDTYCWLMPVEKHGDSWVVIARKRTRVRIDRMARAYREA